MLHTVCVSVEISHRAAPACVIVHLLSVTAGAVTTTPSSANVCRLQRSLGRCCCCASCNSTLSTAELFISHCQTSISTVTLALGLAEVALTHYSLHIQKAREKTMQAEEEGTGRNSTLFSCRAEGVAIVIN